MGVELSVTTDTEDPFVVVAGADERYVLGLAVTMYTTLSNLSERCQARVVVVDGGITPASRVRLERVISTARPCTTVIWHQADVSRFAGAKVSRWGSAANYLRLMIPEIVEDTTRVIYLDSDLLIRHDLHELWKTAVSHERPAVHAVRDYCHRIVGSVFGEEGCKELGIDPERPYFNSGVLVVHIPVWRTDGVGERAIQFAREHADLMRFSDQDALNAIVGHRWTQLDDSWNVMISCLGRYADYMAGTVRERRERKRNLIRNALILHYSGSKKPWKPGYLGPRGREYRDHLYRCQWFESSAEKVRWITAYWIRSLGQWAFQGYRGSRKRLARFYRFVMPNRLLL